MELFRLIDWMMDLPKELDKQFFAEFAQFEEAKKMPYVTSVERLGFERGEAKGRRETLLETIATGLKARFKEEGAGFMATVQQVQDIDLLRDLYEALWTAATLDDLRRLIP